MKHRRLSIITFLSTIIGMSLFSCHNSVNSNNAGLKANAGEDQETIVGSYVILDAGQSTGEIDWYGWEQDEENPDTVKVFSSSDDPSQLVGFVKEGMYKFRLTVKSGEESSDPDEVRITVLPNPSSRFEDPNLEIMVRAKLEIQIAELTDSDLLRLDSLQCIVTPDKVVSLEGIENCKNLIFLGMSVEQISDISPVSTLVKLKRLDLDQNRLIADISPLSGLTELEWLNLDSNLITDISALVNLIKLKYLNLQLNPIMSLDAVKNMTELETLKLFQANLTDVSMLANLSKLECLWIIQSNVIDISSFSTLTNIKNLHLAWNQISDISSLANMEKLEWVALEQNQITDISPLQNLPNLSYVRLWDNQITNIKPLVDNPNIGEGDIVGLNDNPLDEISINEYIPELQERGVAVTW